MLSDLERKRLKNRTSTSSQIRASNDMRVRNKLANWLDDLDDVDLSLLHLPEDQIRDLIADYELLKFLDISAKFINIKKIYPVVGEVEKPEEWQVQTDANNKIAARNLDIVAAKIIGELNRFYAKDNPVTKADFLTILEADPRFRERVTEGERKGVNRLRQALDWYKRPPEIISDS